MASRLTVIRSRLSAWICQPFCCQRTINSESIGMPWSALTAAPNKSAQDLSGGSYRLQNSLAFQLSFSSFPEGSPENKKTRRRAPGTELTTSALRAKLDRTYPVLLVRYLTLGSCDCPTDPTVTPLNGPRTLASP